MRTIYIIACSKEKKQFEAAARDLYVSRNFKLRKKLAEAYADQWFVLSAKYGLLDRDSVIAPYNKNLADLDKHERKQWLNNVKQKLEPSLTENTNLVCLGDDDYFKDLSDWLVNRSVSVSIPYRHLPEEMKNTWLKQNQPSTKRVQDVARLYSMLKDPLLMETQFRSFSECTGSMVWPQRGIYIFYEPGYNRMLCSSELKIMRVGTHAVSKGSSSSLWKRLKTHKGNEDFSGKHRASIFRLHVGTALIARDGLDCPSWGIGQSTNRDIEEIEAAIEKRVSEYLRGMKVLSIRIEDPPSKISDRAYIEQNMIALLSGPVGPVDLAKESWLGYHCHNPAVRRSSLWNVEYTDMEYDPNFLDILQVYIDVSAGRISPPEHSLAPMHWLQSAKSGYRQHKLDFG
ncbi:hypothetical protein ES703_61377 [subsurface metagenome]